MGDSSNRRIHGYPRFENRCERTQRVGIADIADHSLANGVEHVTWSDGSRIFIHDYARFPTDGPPVYEYATGFAACIQEDGSLGAVFGEVTLDEGVGEPTFIPMTGRPFSPRDEAAHGVALVGDVGSRPNGDPIVAFNLAIDDGYAYLACSDGLDVVDVRDPIRPFHVSHLQAPGASFNDVRVMTAGGRKYAFVAAGSTYLIDVTDPIQPTLIADLDAISHSLQLQVAGSTTYLYVAGLGSAIPVFDVTSPLAPVNLGFIRLPNQQPGVDSIHDLFVAGTLLYVNDGPGGTIAIDVAGGFDNPVEVGRFAPAVPAYSHGSWAGVAGGRKVLLTGDEGGTGTPDGMAFLRILDGEPSSPTFMAEIGRYQSRATVGIHYFQLVDDRVFIAYYQDGLRVVDLSDPTQPQEVAHYNTWDNENAYGGLYEGAIGIRVVDDLIYVADSRRGLLILRLQP